MRAVERRRDRLDVRARSFVALRSMGIMVEAAGVELWRVHSNTHTLSAPCSTLAVLSSRQPPASHRRLAPHPECRAKTVAKKCDLSSEFDRPVGEVDHRVPGAQEVHPENAADLEPVIHFADL